MRLSFNKLILAAVIVEALILVASYLLHPAIEDTFRYAARYSGRFSFFVFLYTFFLYSSPQSPALPENMQAKNFISLFAIIHVIHLGFLAMSVYLNEIPLETVKIIGGALAYSLIVVAPFILYKAGQKFQLFYFYYVSLVMALTFVARIKGEFEGSPPYWFHYFGVALMALCAIFFGFWIRKKTTSITQI